MLIYLLVEQFFDNIQDNLVNPVFDLLQSFSLDVDEMELEIDELMIIDFNLTNLRLQDLKIDNKKQLIILGNDTIKLEISDFSG